MCAYLIDKLPAVNWPVSQAVLSTYIDISFKATPTVQVPHSYPLLVSIKST